MRAPQLTPDELEDWAEHRIGAVEAQRWYQATYDHLGPPTPATWNKPPAESPSTCALSWAISWLTALDAGSHDECAPWIAAFPDARSQHGAESAAEWRNTGLGTPDRPAATGCDRDSRLHVLPRQR